MGRLPRSLWALLLAGWLVLLPAGAAAGFGAGPGDAPLLWRNGAPVAATLGLPRARSADLPRSGAWRVDVLWELGSHFTTATSARESVVFDGETMTLLAAIEYGISEDWALSLELPAMRHAGGFLDGFIDQWHDWFGLPDGGRDGAPKDRLLMHWDVDGEPRLHLTDSHTGLGDLRLGLARSLHRSPARDLVLRLDLELPTGRASRLTGNGGVDVALGLNLVERAALSALGLGSHVTLGLLRPGGDDVAGSRLRHWVGYGSWTLVWPLTPRLSLKAQLDAHSALMRTDLKQVGGWSVQGGLGGAWQFSPTLALEFAVYEDLRVGTAPDVSFQFALRGRY